MSRLAGSEQKAEDTSADPLGGFGADEAEQAAEVEEPLQATEDDYDVEEALEEEEETVTLGGDQFTPEQIAVAEAAFIRNQVSCPVPSACCVFLLSLCILSHCAHS